MTASGTKKKWRYYLRLLLWIFIIQFVLLNISAFLHAGKLTRFYPTSAANATVPTKNIFAKTLRLFTGPKYAKPADKLQRDYKFQAISFKTNNGKNIEAWYAKTDSVPKGTVVLFHGLANSKSSLIRESNEFSYLGYNVMLVDFRGHGNSDGYTTTIGWYESEEVKLAYDWLQKKGESKIFLWGFSMGATAIIKSIHDYDLKPAGVILEMPFGSLHRHMKGRAPTLGFPKEPFGVLVTFWAGVRRGFNGFNYNTNRFAEKLNCPVLYQWADKDIYVTKKEAENIFNSIASTKKKMITYKNAVHGSLVIQDITQWRMEVEGFLESVK